MTSLRSRLQQPGIVVAPGCFDALSALLIERAGFSAAYLSGASIAYTRFGRPDLGLVSMSEVADTIGAIRERVDIPLIVDADTGFGNALNVIRTVKLFANRGATAIQLEDQTMPKRCGHLADKTLIPAAEMVGKLKAALDARPDPGDADHRAHRRDRCRGLRCRRSTARRPISRPARIFSSSKRRATTPNSPTIGRRFGGRVPLLANMVEGGKTPPKSAAELEALGFRLVIFPGGTARALVHCLQDYFADLRKHGTHAALARAHGRFFRR